MYDQDLAQQAHDQQDPMIMREVSISGAAGLYLEVHPEPDHALCDRETQLPLPRAEKLLLTALEIHRSRVAEGPWV